MTPRSLLLLLVADAEHAKTFFCPSPDTKPGTLLPSLRMYPALPTAHYEVLQQTEVTFCHAEARSA